MVVVAKLLNPAWRVEIEMDAVIQMPASEPIAALAAELRTDN